MLRLSLLLLLSCVVSLLSAQTVLSGTVLDESNNEPIVGAAVVVAGTTTGTVTDIDGYFSLRVEQSPADVEISYLGYKPLAVKRANGRLGNLVLQPDSKALDDVVVKSSVAVARKTPVALSSITPQLIEERLGAQEFPEIMKSTPGVHANKQGGGYGDSEIYMRGFDNTNVAMMVNGVPMNDMENGSVYWSNWAGLSDVASNVQTQRGLGASKVSSPSVGGTMNIITKGLDAKKGGVVSYSTGEDNSQKILVSFSTGFMPRGWAVSVLAAKQWGDGHAQGMDYVGYNYFFSISKRINDNHQIGYTIFGAPQWHNQRNSYAALTLAQWKYAEKIYGVGGYRYNASYGFDVNGQRKTMAYNVYHKPQMSLNHQWQISPSSNLSTSVYASLGRGYGYSGEANGNIGNYSYTDFRGAYNGIITTKFRKADGTFDYAAMQEINASSDHGSAYVMSKSSNYHNWVGMLSTYTTTIRDLIDFYGGIDFRWYKGKHNNEIVDLYNGAYYIDPERSDVDSSNNKNALNSSWVNEKLHVGDIIYRDYDGHVVQEGAFFQAEYNKSESLSAFLAGSLSNTSYWRYDRFYYDEEHAKSDVMSYMGFTVKGGANYNLTDHHNVFVNLGYISRAPKFSYGAFMSSTTSNATNPDAKNEKILSFEVGYGYKLSVLDVRFNGYITKWKDKTMSKSGDTDNQVTYYMNMTGVDALHKGIELEVKAPLAKWVELNGMLSVGDWKWDSNATGYIYDEHGNPLTSKGVVTTLMSEEHAYSTINLKGVRVGGSAQTTAALGANFNIDAIRIGADWTLYARNYSYYSLSGSNLSLGKTTTVEDPWRVPSSSTIDLHASYRFAVGGVKANLSGNVNNLLNYQYMTKAWNPSSGSATDETVYGFFDVGRLWTLRLKLSF